MRITRAPGKKRGGTVEVLKGDLYRPHGVIPFGRRRIISDSRHGVVHLIGARSDKLLRTFDFSKFPLPAADRDMGYEWIQHTYPVSWKGKTLLATVDSRRSKIYFWDWRAKTYSEYSTKPTEEIQAIMPRQSTAARRRR